MEEKIRENLKELNERLGLPYRLDLVDPKGISLVDKNARYMTNEMFENLVSNIKSDGNLSSVPLCVRERDGGLTVLSGNHRVQAAVKAGLVSILVFVIEKELTKDELRAIQLSHNAIVGTDDPVILKELWDEIRDIEQKVYAGLDTETIKKLEAMEFDSIAEARLDFKAVTFLFLPEEEGKLNEVLARIDEVFSGDSAYLAGRSHYQRLFEAIVKAKEGYNIINNAVALMKLIELAEEGLKGSS